ncbi:MAG: hypothetical protein HFG65_12145 [Hungatella sp.]|nr:hypothetical protein [Hungatella sp.]
MIMSMNEYCYADIALGHEESFSVKIDQEKMDMFRNITGDVNALHNDLDFAVRGGIKERLFMVF